MASWTGLLCQKTHMAGKENATETKIWGVWFLCLFTDKKELNLLPDLEEKNMRTMGLDFGSKTVGVAVSDPLGMTAQGVEIVRRKAENKLRQTLARIEELIKEYEVDLIVLGYPKNMNNTLGDRVEKTMEFKEMLERRTGLEVKLWDERLTTVEADRTLIEGRIRREDRKQYVDMIAAVLILQGFLDRSSFIQETEE